MMSANDARVLELVGEIRDLYARTCALADEHGGICEADDRELIEKCRPRGSQSIPELGRFKSIFDQQDAIRKARRNAEFKRIERHAQAITSVALFFAWVLAFRWTGSMPVAAAFTVLFGTAAFIMVNRWLYCGVVRKCLRRELVAQGVPICMSCGYDLRGQVDPRCPECGARSAIVPTAPPISPIVDSGLSNVDRAGAPIRAGSANDRFDGLSIVDSRLPIDRTSELRAQATG